MALTGKPRALTLIDRDGCLIEEKEYLHRPEEAALYSRSARAIRLLQEEGIARVVCTNQSGVARGFFTEADVQNVNRRVEELLAAEGASMDGYYYAPQHQDAVDPRYRSDLRRRKPGPGMAEEAMSDLGLRDIPVFAVGDRVSDVKFGINAGGTGFLVRTGYGEASETQLPSEDTKRIVFNDLYDACRGILAALIRNQAADPTLDRKLRTPGQLREVVESHREKGEKVVLANGCFDLLHGGHVSFLEGARAAGDVLVLAVNSNASIARLKGPGRPILEEPHRLMLLAALQAVDYLTVFYTESADEVLEEVLPDIHAKGTDYASDNVPERQTSRRLGIKTVIAGAAKENSTRDILEIVTERAAKGLL